MNFKKPEAEKSKDSNSSMVFILFLKRVCLFILSKRERVREFEQGEGQTERKTEDAKQALC